MLTKQQVIERMCVQALNMASAMNWEHPADCFCDNQEDWLTGYAFSEKVMAEIEEAIRKHIQDKWMA